MQHILIIEKDMERVPIDMPKLKQKRGNLACYKYLAPKGKLNKITLLWTKVSCLLLHNLVFYQPLNISTSLPLL